VLLKDGTVLEFGPDEVDHLASEHDGYTIGDQPCVVIGWSGLRAFAGCRAGSHGRVLVTLLAWEQGVGGAGLDRPCRARPADRSLVAEDQSAGGVHDQTGPIPRGC
jgi:hypothetical protein